MQSNQLTPSDLARITSYCLTAGEITIGDDIDLILAEFYREAITDLPACIAEIERLREQIVAKDAAICKAIRISCEINRESIGDYGATYMTVTADRITAPLKAVRGLVIIKLNGNATEVDSEAGKSSGADVRAKLQPQLKSGYTLWREGDPDEMITDTTEVRDGDSIYSIPPCHGA